MPPKPKSLQSQIAQQPNGCWYWAGFRDHNGYGKTRYCGKKMGAHRRSWMEHFGEIPDGLWVLHRCDVKHCVNPSHLFLGTPSDNSRDMHSKGRNKNPIGEQHRNSKLTVAQVADIKRRYIRGQGRWRPTNAKELANEFGVCLQTIINIGNGRVWRHVCP